MKKFIVAACVAVLMLVTVGFSGCRTVNWTPQLAYQTAYCVGITAGAVLDSKKLEPAVTDNILSIMELCRATIPNESQTFTMCWTPLMDKYLESKKDIPDATKQLIKTAFGIVVAAIDMEVTKHPEIVQSKEYVLSVADGLLNGVKYYIKPSNSNVDDCCHDVTALGKTPKIDYELFKKLDEMLR